jgi:hypothetical protein
VQKVTDMDIDEVSLVDRAACPPAAIVFSKRADQEESMPDYLDAEGKPLDLSQFEEGSILVDDEGNEFMVTFEDDADDIDDDTEESELDDDRELVGVGKSAFGTPSDGAVASIREALSKAVNEQDRDAVLSKAFTGLSKRAEIAERRLAAAEQIAKSERDTRLQREYIAKAAEYNVPIDAEDLGPVLMRAAEALSYDDCAVIHKALSAAGAMLFNEAGYDGMNAADDPMDQIEALLGEQVAKGDGGTPELAMTAFFDHNPAAYDAIRAEQRR